MEEQKINQEEKKVSKVQELMNKLEDGVMEVASSEKYINYLNAMSKFHNYSFRNTLLIAMQKPDATLVAGYESWKKNFERNVKKNEKAIQIIVPKEYTISKEVEKIDPKTNTAILDANGKLVMEEEKISKLGFGVGYVFDVSQTEGKDLPLMKVAALEGDVKNYDNIIKAIRRTSPVPIMFEPLQDGVNGSYIQDEKRIVIQKDLSQLQTIKTAIHEMTHAKLHDIDSNNLEALPDRKTCEVQAESVAYVVCQHYGLDTSEYSFNYITGWSKDKDVSQLKNSLETIYNTSTAFIKDIDKQMWKINSLEKESKIEADDIHGVSQAEPVPEKQADSKEKALKKETTKQKAAKEKATPKKHKVRESKIKEALVAKSTNIELEMEM